MHLGACAACCALRAIWVLGWGCTGPAMAVAGQGCWHVCSRPAPKHAMWCVLPRLAPPSASGVPVHLSAARPPAGLRVGGPCSPGFAGCSFHPPRLPTKIHIHRAGGGPPPPPPPSQDCRDAEAEGNHARPNPPPSPCRGGCCSTSQVCRDAEAGRGHDHGARPGGAAGARLGSGGAAAAV